MRQTILSRDVPKRYPFYSNVYDAGYGSLAFHSRDGAERLRSRRHRLLYRIRVIPKPPLNIQQIRDFVQHWLDACDVARYAERKADVRRALDLFDADNVSKLQPDQYRPFLKELGIKNP